MSTFAGQERTKDSLEASAAVTKVMEQLHVASHPAPPPTTPGTTPLPAPTPDPQLIAQLTQAASQAAAAAQAAQYADGPAEKARFNRPSAVAVDRAQNVYVCDFSSNRIRKISAADGMVTTFAGCGVAGRKDGPAKEAQFHFPNHICTDQSNE